MAGHGRVGGAVGAQSRPDVSDTVPTVVVIMKVITQKVRLRLNGYVGQAIQNALCTGGP